MCKRIREVAADLKIKMDKVMKVMKDIIAKGVAKAKEIIEEIKKHFFPGNGKELLLSYVSFPFNCLFGEQTLVDNLYQCHIH